ncbi:uncharacterized protein LOC117785954 [Drosophila innubila]|uniref:uncharacterized protein LOC117785954 n=1 Tax=Drosophila innubila TaxID=198719 RepID=UPI00148BAE4E|nr:uncharacterized protein LOC117785954 [Drosophila innubila]
MRDLHSLADCWIQMLMIKKKIKRKSIKLNIYKLQGRKRLKAMRKLKDELLKGLRTLIDMKLKRIRWSKRGGGRMMRLYRIWLRQWQKYLKNQQVKLKEMDQEELELDRQLRQLRKQLNKLPNRRHVLIKYLKDFNKALESNKGDKKPYSQKENDVMKIELKNIIAFLLSRNKKFMRSRLIADRHDINFSTFWKLAVEKNKLNKIHKRKISELSIGSIGNISQGSRKKTLSQPSSKIEVPSMQKLDSTKDKKNKSNKKHRKKASAYSSSNIIVPSIQELYRRKAKQHRSNKMYKPRKSVVSIGSIGSIGNVPKIQPSSKSEVPSIRQLYRMKTELSTLAHNDADKFKKVLHKLKVKDSKLKQSIPESRIALEDILDLPINLRKTGLANKKRAEKLFNAKSTVNRLKQDMNAHPLSKIAPNRRRMLQKKMAAAKERQLRKLKEFEKDVETVAGDSVVKVVQSKPTTRHRQSTIKNVNIVDTKPTTHYQKPFSKNGNVAQNKATSHHRQSIRRIQDNENATDTTTIVKPGESIEDFKPLKQAASDIDDLMKNKSVSAGIHTYRDQKSPQWKLFQRVLASKKKRRMGSDLLTILEKNDQPKLRPVQTLLEDVIKGPTMLDILADKDEILKVVGKHYMWKNLATVYQDLTSVGVGKLEIYKVLREQYLRYIDDIVGESINNGARVVSRSEMSSISQSLGDSSDSFEEYITKSKPRQDVPVRKSLFELRESSSRASSIVHRDDVNKGTKKVSPLEMMGYKERHLIDRRYSATNLRNIQDAHERYFSSLDRPPVDSRTLARKRQEAAIARDLRRTRKANLGRKERLKKQRQQQRRVGSCRLYYEPSKTCRERSLEDDDKELEDCGCKPECVLPKCSRCGVELPPLSLSPKSSSSSSSLSLCSMAACGMNQQLLEFTADICDHCGFIHDQQSACNMVIEPTTSKTLQQLRIIKKISQCPDVLSQQSSLRFAASLQRICSCADV